MGSPEERTPPAKPPNPKTAAAAATSSSTAPPPATPQELPTTPSYSAEWAAAFYGPPGASVAPPIFQPWAGQHLVAPYGTPIAYSPMYHPAAALYAHPSIAAAALAYPTVESGNGNKSKGGSGKSGDGGKVTSGSADEYASQSGGSSGSEGSSDTRDEISDPQDASRKRSCGDAFGEGETSHPITAAQNTAESAYSGRGRTAAKLPVSAPGRAALPCRPTNLNIGMDLWNTSHVGTAPVKDERELKRERRKQSNRESARRSRLRKQQECEDLARKVAELNNENSALKIELEQLNKVCKDLEADNASIVDELNRILGRGVASELEGIDCNSSSMTPSIGGEGSGHVPQNPVGSNGKMHRSGRNFESNSR